MFEIASCRLEDQRWKMEDKNSICLFQMFILFFLKMHDEVEDGTETSNGTVTCKREGGIRVYPLQGFVYLKKMWLKKMKNGDEGRWRIEKQKWKWKSLQRVWKIKMNGYDFMIGQVCCCNYVSTFIRV